MAKLNALDWTALILVIIGAINWGLFAFGFNLVTLVFGAVPGLEKFVYFLVGLAGLYVAYIAVHLCKKG